MNAKGIWGKKVGMTQVFADDSSVLPVTAIAFSRWVIAAVKTVERDGYKAVQIGSVRPKHAHAAFSKCWLSDMDAYFTVVREVPVVDGDQGYSVGSDFDPFSCVSEGTRVDVTGTTTGRGFLGVVKRYNFAGAKDGHSCRMGNTPGSLSFMCANGKVIKGKKMPGHQGDKTQTIKNLEIVRVLSDDRVILVKGSVPGKAGSLLFIKNVDKA